MKRTSMSQISAVIPVIAERHELGLDSLLGEGLDAFRPRTFSTVSTL